MSTAAQIGTDFLIFDPKRTFRKMKFLKNPNKAKLIEEFPTDAALEAYNQQYYDLCRRENIKDFLIHLASNVKLKVKFCQRLWDMKIQGSKFRGLAWRVFLGALGEDKEHWILETKKERAEYAMLLDRYKPNRPTEQLSGDPLSDDGEKNGWGQKFRDEGMVYLTRLL